ncbi:MAG: hypothetical protein ACJASL_002695 [Paraglaciecola sp.]|jgi:hypothetical protein
MLKKHFLWMLYGIFVIIAMSTHTSEPLFVSQGDYPYGKPILWLVLLGFLAYSLYCHVKENFFKTMSITSRYYWTKQIGIDLYLGVAVSGAIIYLNEGSMLILCLWLLPLILFANLATLLYFAMNYDSLVAHFL